MPDENVRKSRYTEAQKKAAEKYLKESVEDIRIRVPKGQKSVIKSHADSRNESVNGFIQRAISEAMDRDNATPSPPQPLSDSQPAPVSTPTPEATETPQDGTLVLTPFGVVPDDNDYGKMKELYHERTTRRGYFVSPQMTDRDWEAMQRHREEDSDDPEDGLPF